jgi:hypothetical protein
LWRRRNTSPWLWKSLGQDKDVNNSRVRWLPIAKEGARYVEVEEWVEVGGDDVVAIAVEPDLIRVGRIEVEMEDDVDVGEGEQGRWWGWGDGGKK